MTTLTIIVNERTKAGKAFMAMAETFFKDGKGIEIVSTGLNKRATKVKNELSEDFELACKQLKTGKPVSSKKKTYLKRLKKESVEMKTLSSGKNFVLSERNPVRFVAARSVKRGL